MSFEPYYDLNLEPGMVADYIIDYRVLPEELLKIRTQPGSALLVSQARREDIELALKGRNFVYLGTHSGDWACHIQLSDRNDVKILKEKFILTEVKDSRPA